MTFSSDSIASDTIAPKYAKFTPRFRAILIDALILATMFYFGALIIHSTIDSEETHRALFKGLILCILLYEPILVAMVGGTLGHRFMNLRVVDNQTNNNLGLAKAFARAIIKGLLGWLSFVSMSVARRHQALHDILTKSTVQVRDASTAYAHHFALERSPDNSSGTPSRVRHMVVIATYMIFTYLLLSFGLFLFISSECFTHEKCNTVEIISSNVAVLLWLALSVWFTMRGWKGQLYGCRKLTVSKSN